MGAPWVPEWLSGGLVTVLGAAASALVQGASALTWRKKAAQELDLAAKLRDAGEDYLADLMRESAHERVVDAVAWRETWRKAFSTWPVTTFAMATSAVVISAAMAGHEVGVTEGGLLFGTLAAIACDSFTRHVPDLAEAICRLRGRWRSRPPR